MITLINKFYQIFGYLKSSETKTELIVLLTIKSNITMVNNHFESSI